MKMWGGCIIEEVSLRGTEGATIKMALKCLNVQMVGGGPHRAVPTTTGTCRKLVDK